MVSFSVADELQHIGQVPVHLEHRLEPGFLEKSEGQPELVFVLVEAQVDFLQCFVGLLQNAVGVLHHEVPRHFDILKDHRIKTNRSSSQIHDALDRRFREQMEVHQGCIASERVVDEDHFPAFPLLLYLRMEHPGLFFKTDLFDESKVFFFSIRLIEPCQFLNDFFLR